MVEAGVSIGGKDVKQVRAFLLILTMHIVLWQPQIHQHYSLFLSSLLEIHSR